MSITEIYQNLIIGIKNTTALEYIAGSFGIISVLFSRKESIWVYPTGLVSTILYMYLCYDWNLRGEASLNFYYTVMSIYGWWLWAKHKNAKNEDVILKITPCNKKEWIISFVFFIVCWAVLYVLLKTYTTSNVPFADAFASGAAYTGMWLMAKKKLENWLWWIITNAASVPLYFYKHAVFTSVQFLLFLILAIMGYISWIKKLKTVNA